MLDGKKKTSKKLLLISYKNISKKSKKKVISIITCSLINYLPILSVKTLDNSKRGSKYLPFFMLSNYRTRLAIKNLFNHSHFSIKKLKSSKYETLGNHLLNSSKFENTSLKTKNDFYKIVFANKKFASYRWF